ncbi:MAG: 16S rRNA (uracil(1498)-N(3))-methyltransferase [Acidobacteriota bacterium]
MPRLFVPIDIPLSAQLELDLPESVSRHVQVLRMQPGERVVLFDGRDGQWSAEILSMGRKVVRVGVRDHEAVSRELPRDVTLVVGMPANDRMDALVEKATELGVAAVQPLMCERSVLRLDGERAAKKVAHWQGVAIAAAEQSGRTRVPLIHEVRPLTTWLKQDRPAGARCGVLSLREAKGIRAWAANVSADDDRAPVYFLSGPEGGLAPQEEDAVLQSGWEAVSLGSRVLRADTAPLMALGVMAAWWDA